MKEWFITSFCVGLVCGSLSWEVRNIQYDRFGGTAPDAINYFIFGFLVSVICWTIVYILWVDKD